MSVFHVSINRKLTEKLSFHLRYAIPDIMGGNFLSGDRGMGRTLVTKGVNGKDDEGKIYDRSWYHYFEGGVQLPLYRYKKHSFSANQFISIARGKDTYLTKVVTIERPDDPFHIVSSESEIRRGTYFGGVTGVRYDYSLWKSRIILGANLSIRYYLEDFPVQVNYGIHSAYNF